MVLVLVLVRMLVLVLSLVLIVAGLAAKGGILCGSRRGGVCRRCRRSSLGGSHVGGSRTSAVAQ